MPGLDVKVVVHRLSIKRSLCHVSPRVGTKNLKGGQQTHKGTILHEVKYPRWVVKIVPVRKNNQKLRSCVNFQVLNDACLMDDFLLAVIECMINSATGHKALSLMDCTLRYNQMQIAPENSGGYNFPHTERNFFIIK